MITRFKIDNKKIIIRRYRIDALLITLSGLAGGGFLLFLVSTSSLNPVVAILPMLFAVAASMLGMDTLRKRGVEKVSVDLDNKIISAKMGRNREGKIPFTEIDKLEINKRSFLNLTIVQGKHEFILFESFLFSPRIYRFCTLLHDAGIPVSTALKAKLINRSKIWKITLLMLLFLWLTSTITWMVLRR